MALTVSSICQHIAPSATLRLNAIVAEKRKQGADIISLAAGEPDFDTPLHVRDAAKRAIDSGKTKYTATSGLPELRRALADYLLAHKGLSYQPSEIIVGTGAKQVIMEALIAMLDPGDEVIIPAPCWLSYPEMVRMAGGVPVIVRGEQAHGFVPSRAQLAAAFTPRTRAILVNSPNNPTGAVWPLEALRMVADLAKEHDCYIISDEIYECHVYSGSVHYPVAAISPDAFSRTVTISGFSKAYAMTGWRMGYAAGPKALMKAMDAYQSHATGNPCSVTQYAALAALLGDQACVGEMNRAFERRCQLILSLLEEIPGLSFIRPQGAFYVLVDVSGLFGRSYHGRVLTSDDDVVELLLDQALVSVVGGTAFFAPGCIRLSYATSEDRLREAARRIAAFVQQLAPAEKTA